MIWPNGTRALETLGVEVKAMPVERLFFCNWRGGRVMEIPGGEISRRYGSGVAFVHRADLQAALARSFGRDALQLGVVVDGFNDEGPQVHVKLRDGTAAEGDLLVGADGLRSAVRGQLLRDGDPVYLGSTTWRGIAGSEGIALRRGDGFNWVGRGSEFIAFFLADDRIYWACVAKEPPGERAGPGGHKQDVLERFHAWAEPIPALVAGTNEGAILRTDMFDRPPIRRWSRGRVTLVGDAAHPMTPNAGQGACQALEDAIALGESLARAPDLRAAFDLYERRRLRRANRVVTLSRQASRSVQIEGALLSTVREGFGRLLPRWMLFKLLDQTLAP